MSKIHTTIGIYPNGDFKVNGVRSEHLKDHIEYNKLWRFGRALMVDGELIYRGCHREGHFETIIADKKLQDIKMDKDTAPYV